MYKKPTSLQVSLTRFLSIWYLVGNEAVNVLTLILISLKPIIYHQFTGLGFMKSCSLRKFVEASEMLSLQSIFFAIWKYAIISLYKFNNEAN